MGTKKFKVNKRSEFVKLFSKCHKYQPTFDDCVKDGLNEARPYFQHGVPEFDIPPFDPFFAEEIIQMRGSQSLNYKLTLRNVYESGWTKSHVYRFKSDLKNGYVQYNQWFPEKFLQGEWEIEYNLMGPYANAGTFNLTLYNYTQVTTINLKKGNFRDPYSPFKVRVNAIDSGDMELHVDNLITGLSPTLEFIVDRLLNISWRPGFMVLKPLIDDIVSTAFTKIFNDAFRNFPFEKVFYK
ncbi:hypothetical protein RUM44_004120 [Polyplax serrata]|uniref:Uncharacterized protein n=1 Tax=Polyplax serrata TaxID=468196 RepID=A0ABR1B3H4_POLSC